MSNQQQGQSLESRGASHAEATDPKRNPSIERKHTTVATENVNDPGWSFGTMRRVVAQDITISLPLKGMLIVITSYPPWWVFHRDELRRVCNVGMKIYRKTIAEAKKLGFLETVDQKYIWKRDRFERKPGDHASPSSSEFSKLGDHASPSSSEFSKLGDHASPRPGDHASPLIETLETKIKSLVDSSNQPERGIPKLDDDQSNKIGEGSVQITGKKQNHSAQVEVRDRRERRHKLAAKQVDALYKFFYERVGLDPAALSAPTAAHRKMANDRFLECAKLVMLDANGHEEKLADEEWVQRSAEKFGEVIASYCENTFVKKKTWSHLCSPDTFRAELAPKPERVMAG